MKSRVIIIDETVTRIFDLFGVRYEVTQHRAGWEDPGERGNTPEGMESPDSDVKEEFVSLIAIGLKGERGDQSHDDGQVHDSGNHH